MGQHFKRIFFRNIFAERTIKNEKNYVTIVITNNVN